MDKRERDTASESYTQTDNPAFEARLALRTAEVEAAFFLPHLRPSMDLMDVGCGPATITVGLAEAVAPGAVVGVDRDAGQIERSRANVAARGVVNVRLEVADVYDLPFPDASFDAAFAHIVFLHLREPVRALQEIRRVLRPGGIVGLRDPDVTTIIHSPHIDVIEEYRHLRMRAQEVNGNPGVGRDYRALLLESGFARSEAGATVNSAGNPAECREIAAFLKSQLPGVGRTALAQGWVDQARLDEIERAVDTWTQRPDAFHATIFCHVIGWASG